MVRTQKFLEKHNDMTTDTSLRSAATTGPSPSDHFCFPVSLKLNVRRLFGNNSHAAYRSVFRLRYQVYCHEARFLNPADYPEQLEVDDYDPVSEHFIASNLGTEDEPVGVVRLVRWSDNLSFPTSKHYNSLDEKLALLNYPIKTTAEISRLCISKLYRKRAEDGLHGLAGYGDNSDARRKYPVILLELFKIMYRSSKEDLGITHWIAAFEDGLYRLLNRYGIRLELITPNAIEYYGKVKIYGASIQYIEEALRASRPELFEFFIE